MSSLQKACHFLCLVFFFLNFQPNLSSSSSSCAPNESSALIQFKSSFSIMKRNYYYYCEVARIHSYRKTDSWKEGTDCCSWDGVTCDNIKGHVIGLDLSCGLLYGSIHSNSTLFHLPHLQKLNLAFNDFNAFKMSSKFGEFASLVHLNLSCSNFSGHVPSQVSHLSKLVSLDLSGNDLQTFDKYSLERLVHNLTEVRQLFLDGINMSSVNPNVLMNLSSSLRSLSLYYCDLRGKFPESIFHLPNLKTLDLGYNKNLNLSFPQFNRSIHLELLDLSAMSFSTESVDWIGKLQSLKYLDLSETSFSKGLPDSIGNLVSLKELHLSTANLMGSIPRSLGNLSSLRSLDLIYCGLQGNYPENIFQLPSLKMLYLGSNVNLSLPKSNRSSHLELLDLSFMPLSKRLIDSINNLSYLEHLDVSNAISSVGGLLDSIGNLISLKYLVAYDAQLSGPIPKALGNLLKLNHLDLWRNNLSGQIPSSLIKNLSQLEFLDLGANQLEGPIPDEVSVFPNLIILDLSSNFLNGTLPSWLYTISSLKSIVVSNNQFSGHIKEFQYHSLEEIILSSNKLQGPIPSSISTLLNLTSLDLFSNKLHGPIPSSISTLLNLISLDLSSNKLQGPIPSSISTLLNLTSLDLSSNKLSGMFSKLQNLRYLDLSSNSLSLIFNGTNVDHSLPNLQSLSLSSCNLKEFPQFLRGSKSLQYLDLSNNGIHGKIPKWMGKNCLSYLNLSRNYLTDIDKQLPWKEIQFLDLSFNSIHGDLPIPPLTTYVYFITNNRLNGEISSLICDATSLDLLDLSHNNLSGTIPQCFGNLSQSVSMLNLRMNKLQGIIPPTFTKGCQLKNLNVNGNQLGGPLTRSIVNCTSLEVLDLGNNKINDTFPHWLGSLPQLQVLVLRSNQLHGSINDSRPSSSFFKIQIFDLSSNYFTGRVPVRYIKNFKSMINLTFNESAKPYMGVRGNHSNLFYSYSIGISMKGLEMEVVKIFTMLTSIDLSNNKFEGGIPKDFGNLMSLIGLNLSHNNLNGSIPDSVGNLINLEWLDLSSNQLVGAIPERLVDLTFLSVFNVSKNQLEGQIPQGKQFGTFGNDSYKGNRGLCGFPVSKGCSNSEPPPSNLMEEDDLESNISFGWKVVLIGYGCGIVFGLAMGYVVFQTGKPKWLVTLVEDRYHKRGKTSKIGNRRR